jgi:hypothetical protein
MRHLVEPAAVPGDPAARASIPACKRRAEVHVLCINAQD